MITLEDCIGFRGLTKEEVLAKAGSRGEALIQARLPAHPNWRLKGPRCVDL